MDCLKRNLISLLALQDIKEEHHKDHNQLKEYMLKFIKHHRKYQHLITNNKSLKRIQVNRIVVQPLFNII